MSMGHAPCTGYVVRVTKKNYKLFGLKTLPSEPDYEGEEEYTDTVKGLIFGMPVEIFYYDSDNGDTYDELQHGNWYAYFEDSDLYVKHETPFLMKLIKAKLKPEFSSWTNFG